RHADPAITSEIYGHLDMEDMRTGINRLGFSSAAEKLAPVVPIRLAASDETSRRGERVVNDAQTAKKAGRSLSEMLKKSADVAESGRLDLNQRPLGPETSKADLHRFRWGLKMCNCLQILRVSRRPLLIGSQKKHPIRNFLLLGCHDKIAVQTFARTSCSG